MKKELRREMLLKRLEQSTEQAKIKSKTVFKKIIKLPQYKNAKTIMVYMPIKGEVLTDKIISHALAFGKKVFAPKVDGDEMFAVAFDQSTQMIIGPFGVNEPCGIEHTGEIDLVLVPGLAFDKKGNRLGFGKGYYDKFLKNRNSFKIGVCYDFQVVAKLPTEKHDIPVDVLVYG